MTDDETVGRLAVRAVFDERYQEFVALGTVMVRDRGVAEDLVQDAFAATLRRVGQLRSLDDLGGYIAQAVVNGARSHHRRRAIERRERPVPPAAPAAADPAAGIAQNEMLELVLQLPERQAQCLICRYTLDQTDAQVARTLGIGVATVKTHLRRGRAQLAIWLEERT